MSRTLDDMIQDLKSIKEEEKAALEVYKNISDKMTKIRNEIKRYKLDNGMYQPISELSNHIGKTIDCIDLVERKDDGTLDVEYIWYYQTNTKHLYVDENGHLNWSYFDITMNYDENTNKYIKRYGNGKEETHDYIGFMYLDFLEIDKDLDGLSSEELFEKIFNT